jgi:RNA polymerase sigma-70 factor (ECF subfamily)
MTTSTFPLSQARETPGFVFPCDSHQARAARPQDDAVVRAQAGDHEAFSELYMKHKRNVLAICMRMVRDYALAEDLTQEAFLQLHRKISLFRGDSAFSTWLHRLAVNTVLMHLRKRALAVVSLDHLMEDIPEERAGRSFGARDLLQAGVADRLDIQRAIDTMAPGYRSIFLLHDIHGFDHGEIASMLKCTRGNTKSQLHKARRIMRVALTPKSKSTGKSNVLFLVPDQTIVTKRRPKSPAAAALLA